MRNLSDIIIESKQVFNSKLTKALRNEGLEKYYLVKDYGYFYVWSDDDEVRDDISTWYENAIYMNSFNQQSVEDWVNDIKRLIEINKE